MVTFLKLEEYIYMCALRSCVDLCADGCDFILSVMSEKLCYPALPGCSVLYYILTSKL